MRIVSTLALTLALPFLSSCSMFRSGVDSVAAGSQATWNAVTGASSAVVKGTTNLGKKTVGAAGNLVGGFKKDGDMVELTFAYSGKQGVILIALDDEAAPKHAENFRTLVKENFYDGQRVHRAVRKHLIQTGDPRSRHEDSKPVWGLGGPGYTIPSEIGLPNLRGSVGMARLGNRLNPTRQSNGSQFYIALKPLKDLDGEYSVFGQVVSGIEVADAISRISTDDNDIPKKSVSLVSARLVKGSSPKTTADPAQPAPATPPVKDSPAPEKKEKTKKEKKEKKKGWFSRALNRVW